MWLLTTLLNDFFQEGRPLSGNGLLKRMKERTFRPECISYSTLFHGYFDCITNSGESLESYLIIN